MAPNTVHIRTLADSSVAVGWAGHHTLTIDRPEVAGDSRRGFSGGELLRLAVGACYYINLCREAERRAIPLRRVDIEVQAEWGGEPERVLRISCGVTVDAEAGEAEIRDLVRHADEVSEIPNSLRLGATVTLADVRAAGGPPRRAAGAPHADAVLEMLGAAGTPGATCAVLTPAIKARLRELAGGQVLEVRVDDPSAREDIAAWCRLAGHKLIAVVDETPAYTRYFLSKKQG